MINRHRHAFTLLELMLAIGIGVIVMGMAVPSMKGLLDEQRLRASYHEFDEFAKKAQEQAIGQQRSWVLMVQPKEIALQPDVPTNEELLAGRASATLTIPIAENESYVIERPAALLKDPPQEWTFWRSGVCEPVIVHYSGPYGKWSARYDAMSGQGEIIAQTLP